MPGDEVRHRKGRSKKSKKGRGKGQSGATNEKLAGFDAQDDTQLLPPPMPPPKKPVEEKAKASQGKAEEESSISICLQVLFPYLLAGMGMVMAGMVLDFVQVSNCLAFLGNDLIIENLG